MAVANYRLKETKPIKPIASPYSTGSTYLSRDSSGNNYADMVGMSDIDRAALAAAKESWARANEAGDTGAMEAAHQQAEALRRKYGYSGGADGSQYLPQQTFTYETAPEYTSRYQSQIDGLLQQIQDRGDFTWDREAPTYTNRYQTQIDELTGQILDRPEFSYDPYTDPLYGVYRKEYTREGQRAAADALGQAAALTGGMPSTAAVAASQQAGDYYAAQMADKIPELQQLAYGMYMDQGNTMRSNLSMLQGLEQGDYNKYLNELGQYNTDRSFALDAWNANRAGDQDVLAALQYLDQADYNQYLTRLNQFNTDRNFAYGQFTDQRAYDYQLGRDEIADSRYNQEWQYQQDRDAVADQQWQSQFDYQRGRDEVADSQWQSQFDYQRGRDEVADSQWEREFAYQQLNDAANRAASLAKSRSSETPSRTTREGDYYNDGDYDQLFEDAAKSANPANYISSHYKEYGFSSISGLQDQFKEWSSNDYSFGYNPDEGVFTFNGKAYSSLEDLEKALNDAKGLTPGQEEAIRLALDHYGFNS